MLVIMADGEIMEYDRFHKNDTRITAKKSPAPGGASICVLLVLLAEIEPAAKSDCCNVVAGFNS